MTTFGTKEAWMEPMNEFLKSHREEFKTYLDNICSISSSASHSAPIPPSYSTPLAILQRLPPTSREGFPSLPYLIDHARNFAALVDLWVEQTRNMAPNIKETDGDLLRFHNICVSLQHRTKECLNRAEEAERPNSPLGGKWEEMVEQLQSVRPFETTRSEPGPARAVSMQNPAVSGSMPASPSGSALNGQGQNIDDSVEHDDDESSEGTNTPMTMKTSARTPTRHRHASSISAPQSSVGSVSSTSHYLTNPFSRKEGKAKAATSSASFVSASASASASVSAAEEDTPPGSSDGMNYPPHPPFAYPSAPSSSFSHSVTSMSSMSGNQAGMPLNMSQMSSHSRSMGTQPPRSAGGYSYEGSEAGSDEVTTALPVFDKTQEKERKERGLQKILPFKSRRKKEEKEKDKEREKEKERERERERWREREWEARDARGYERSGSALGDREGVEF